LRLYLNIWNRLKKDSRNSSSNRNYGKKLTVIASTVIGLVSVGTVASIQSPAAYAATATAHGCSKTYTIVAGDTLSGIAARFHKNWHTLASNNHIANPNLIFAGDKLCLSGTGSVPTHAAPAVTQQATPAPVQQAQPTTTQAPQTTAAPVQTSASGSSVSSMIDSVFGSYAAGAQQVATCESGLNPNATNPYSGAAGIFQIMPATWSGTSEAGTSPYNAYANVVAAHEIFVRDGYSWREWTCQP